MGLNKSDQTYAWPVYMVYAYTGGSEGVRVDQGIVPAGTCTISFITPKKANIYVNDLNTAEYKAVVGVHTLLCKVVIIGKHGQT